MNLKDFKFDKGWKYLVYFDLVLPAILYLISWLLKSPQLALIFHSYEIFVINPIPNFQALTGIIGLILHIGVICYTVIRRNYKDMLLCIVITLLVAAFFFFDVNYLIIRPLTFSNI